LANAFVNAFRVGMIAGDGDFAADLETLMGQLEAGTPEALLEQGHTFFQFFGRNRHAARPIRMIPRSEYIIN